MMVSVQSSQRFTNALEPSLSVVVPVHNEEGNVGPLHAELRQVLDGLRESSEIIFVNDGSDDQTLTRLRALLAEDHRLRIIDLDGNFGEAAALSAGFHSARGGIVITVDGDGQNDPHDIPRLLAALRSRDLDAVSGRREARQEGYWLRVLPSRLANHLIVRATGVPVQDCGCGLKAYRRHLVSTVHLPRGMNRFLPAILGVAANAVAEVPTRDRRRPAGSSHYGIGRTAIVLRDLLAVPFIIRDRRQAHIRFALATAGAAGAAALFADVSRAAMLALDAIAAVLGLIWWNTRRFNRAQVEGVYRVRKEYP